MKNLFFSAIFFFVAVGAMAQESRRPVAGGKSFTFGLQGLNGTVKGALNTTPTINVGNSEVTPSPTLLFRYYLSDKNALRAGINYYHSSSTDQTSSTIKSVVTLNGFGLNLGYQVGFNGTDRLEPYFAADFRLGSSSAKVKNTNGSTSTTTKFDPTTSIGLVPALGFNYYLAKDIAIGAEFGYGFVYSKQNGSGDNEEKSSSIGTIGAGTINVSVFF